MKNEDGNDKYHGVKKAENTQKSSFILKLWP